MFGVEVEMRKRNRGTLMQAKADMDVRVQQLRDVVARGACATKRLPLLREELQATQFYQRTNCMYESIRYQDDEKTPEDLEFEINVWEREVKQADSAKLELTKAASFYRAYHLVVFGPKLRDLRSRLNAAEYWAEQWKNNLLEIGLDSEKNDDESIYDKSHFECEYARVNEEIFKLRAKITEIQNIKYM